MLNIIDLTFKILYFARRRRTSVVHPLSDLLEEQSQAENYYSSHRMRMRTFSTSKSTSKSREKMG